MEKTREQKENKLVQDAANASFRSQSERLLVQGYAGVMLIGGKLAFVNFYGGSAEHLVQAVIYSDAPKAMQAAMPIALESSKLGSREPVYYGFGTIDGHGRLVKMELALV